MTYGQVRSGSSSVIGDTTIVKLDPGGAAVLRAVSEGGNLYLTISDSSSKHLNAINGCGDCSSDLTDSLFLRPVFLSEGKTQQYLIIAPVNGSTYGAEYMFIVWNDGVEWNITKSPFHMYEIRRKGNHDVIVSHDGVTDVEYGFDNGLFLRKP